MASTSWLAYVAGLTIVMGPSSPYGRTTKRRLAYSTISPAFLRDYRGGDPDSFSIMWAAIHIAAHAFGKITLFFAVGSIMVASHKTQVSQLDGIGRRMPITMAAFTIGALSMIGVPPTAGFVSKWYIPNGAISSEHVFAILAIILSTLLNAGYFRRSSIGPTSARGPSRIRSRNERRKRRPSQYSRGSRGSAIDHVDRHRDDRGCTIIMFLTPGLAIDLATQIVGDLP